MENEDRVKDNINKIVESLSLNTDKFDIAKTLLFNYEKDSILELILENYFRKLEGFPFSTDKALFVIEKMKESIEKKEYLSLRENYKDEDRIAYWCPLTLYNTEEAFEFLLAYVTFNLEKMKEFLEKISRRVSKND